MLTTSYLHDDIHYLEILPAYPATDMCIAELQLLVQERLPGTLKKLLVFEDFNDNIARALGAAQGPWHDGFYVDVDVHRIVDPRVGAAFATRSLDLEQLSVSYMANAEDFFRACVRTWTWPHLQSLALTSEHLRITGNCKDIDALLCSAGAAALRMPKLHTLVLWNGRKRNACAFIYRVDQNHASITWRGTWELELHPPVVEAWQRVASRYHSFELRTKKQHIQGTIDSHGDAIHYLKLPCQVVSPASLWQIRKEGEQQWRTDDLSITARTHNIFV